jgi:hypothetical protein
VVTIRMRVGERELVFSGCARCESNTWEDDGDVVSLDEVLELARTTR